MSRLIGATDFNLNNPKINFEVSLKLRKGKILFKHEGLNVYQNKQLIGMLNENNELIYVVKYKTDYTNLIGNYISQIVVWTSDSDIRTSGIASIIFKRFLNDYNVIADKWQTEDGARFWRNRIYEQFRSNGKVGYVDFGSRKVVEIKSTMEFQKYVTQVNGSLPKNEGKRFVIFRK